MNFLKTGFKFNISFQKTSINSLDKLLVDIQLILSQSEKENKDLARSQFHGYFFQLPKSI